MPTVFGAAPDEQILSFGNLILRPGDPRALIDGQTVVLTAQQLKLLKLLIREAGRFVSIQTAARYLARGVTPLTDTGVSVIVHRLRARLRNANVRILTRRGFGYVLQEGSANDEP
jgi:two-component system, OmpR family, response regulator